MMKITKQETAKKLLDYLHHKIAPAELVAWAETAMMEGEFQEGDIDVLREIIGRLGVSDVRAFGLTWEDCEDFLAQLGYRVSVTVAEDRATYG